MELQVPRDACWRRVVSLKYCSVKATGALGLAPSGNVLFAGTKVASVRRLSGACSRVA